MLLLWDQLTSANRPVLIAAARHCGTRDPPDRAVTAFVGAAITCGM
jgi:hypothetical protein